MVKGEVCKTSIPRFKSGWCLTFPAAALGILFLLTACTPPPQIRPAPEDTPPWSSAQYVRWSPLAIKGERVIVIDINEGTVDKVIGDPTVAVMMNHEFLTIFLHPRARPWLTERLGWPSFTVIDDDGCVRASGSPKSKEEALALMGAAIEARESKSSSAIPEPSQQRVPPAGGGDWTTDSPSKSAVFAHPARGAPAVIWEGKPFVFGNRTDAVLVAERPAAGLFLDGLPKDVPWAPTEGPLLHCTK